MAKKTNKKALPTETTERVPTTEKIKKPIYKRWQTYAIAAAVVILIALVLATTLDYSIISAGIKIACKPRNISYPDDYSTITEKTDAKYDVSYESSYDDGYFDIYTPKNVKGNQPTVLYIHGGYYLGGDKKSAEPYCRVLAAEGFVVVSMNYALAPKAKYPTQLKQVNEILGFLTDNSNEYNIDPTQIFIGGDSAGGHLSAQAGAFFTNDELAQKINIKRSIGGENIKGLLLLCGFYDFQTVRDTKFPFLDTAMWAFTDVRNYEKFSRADELNVVKNVTKNYPDSFVTCGSDDPFYAQAEEMVGVLKENKINYVEYLPKSQGNKLKHEFQRDFSLAECKEAMEKTINFLKERSVFDEAARKDEVHAVFALSDGSTFDVLLRRDYAPKTVENFIKYAEAGYYNGTAFHRILKNSVLQGGGYTVKKEFDEKAEEYKYIYQNKTPLYDAIKGEFSSNGYKNNRLSHAAGVISMARTSDPDSATSQFFFCASDCSYYDGQYAAFGYITNPDGIEALRKLTDIGKNESINPVEPIILVSVAIRYVEVA